MIYKYMHSMYQLPNGESRCGVGETARHVFELALASCSAMNIHVDSRALSCLSSSEGKLVHDRCCRPSMAFCCALSSANSRATARSSRITNCSYSPSSMFRSNPSAARHSSSMAQISRELNQLLTSGYAGTSNQNFAVMISRAMSSR